MRNIITLAGDLGSGKGTVSNILEKELNYTIYRNGEYFRSLAKEKGMSVSALCDYVDMHPEIDRSIEESAREYAKNHDNLIIDARLGWYVVPDSFKVYLKVDLDEAARRAFNDPNRKATESFNTVLEQKQDMIKRQHSENTRYKTLYHVDNLDMSNYDLVIDTTYITPDEVADIILDRYKKRFIDV